MGAGLSVAEGQLAWPATAHMDREQTRWPPSRPTSPSGSNASASTPPTASPTRPPRSIPAWTSALPSPARRPQPQTKPPEDHSEPWRARASPTWQSPRSGQSLIDETSSCPYELVYRRRRSLLPLRHREQKRAERQRARLVLVPSDSLVGVERDACLPTGAGVPSRPGVVCSSRAYRKNSASVLLRMRVKQRVPHASRARGRATGPVVRGLRGRRGPRPAGCAR